MRAEEVLTKINQSVARCRQLAEQASDPEAAKALRDIASEFEAIEGILKQQLEQRSASNG